MNKNDSASPKATKPALKVKKSTAAEPVRVPRTKPPVPIRKSPRRHRRHKAAISGKDQYRALVEHERERLMEPDAGMNPKRGLFILLAAFTLAAFITALVIARRTPTPDVLVISRALREANIPYTANNIYVTDTLQLKFYSVNTTNLALLRPLPIEALILKDRDTQDLSGLQGMNLRSLVINDTQVADLSPLRGMPLEFLDMRGTPAGDLTPLDGMPLANIGFTESTVTQGVSVLRRMPSLELINKRRPAHFWLEYDDSRRLPRKSWRDTLNAQPEDTPPHP